MANGAPVRLAAPGWYSNPGDARQYRYWDGRVWTAGVARDGQITEQSISAQSAARVGRARGPPG
ncbi:MAG TPA: DUF2510 domain-containing protein [Acidimicrobiales bacterium]|nr:DUF2510 domain-containing protein [Acidimicrobiales bacterium]